jgi:hypothetical protein
MVLNTSARVFDQDADPQRCSSHAANPSKLRHITIRELLGRSMRFRKRGLILRGIHCILVGMIEIQRWSPMIS